VVNSPILVSQYMTPLSKVDWAGTVDPGRGSGVTLRDELTSPYVVPASPRVATVYLAQEQEHGRRLRTRPIKVVVGRRYAGLAGHTFPQGNAGWVAPGRRWDATTIAYLDIVRQPTEAKSLS
jgi:hypothetical protein